MNDLEDGSPPLLGMKPFGCSPRVMLRTCSPHRKFLRSLGDASLYPTAPAGAGLTSLPVADCETGKGDPGGTWGGEEQRELVELTFPGEPGKRDPLPTLQLNPPGAAGNSLHRFLLLSLLSNVGVPSVTSRIVEWVGDSSSDSLINTHY